MADEARVFSETEHVAILADRVKVETANLTAQVDALTVAKNDAVTKADAATAALEAAKAESASKADVLEAAKVAAETETARVVAEFEAFKKSLEDEKEMVVRKDARLSELKEAAAHLTDEFLTEPARLARILAYSDEDFQGYKTDMKATAAVAPKKEEEATKEDQLPVKEVANLGDPVKTGTPDLKTVGMQFLVPALANEGGK